jgi:hypothetical protein
MKTFLALLASLAACAAAALPNPIIFVTQTPTTRGEPDIGTITGTFTTHLTTIISAPRGGSLHILYPDGTLRDLLADALAEACASGRPTCDPNGAFKLGSANLLVNGYAVREPTVHWDGDKVLFSLVTKVTTQRFQLIPSSTRWQMYEIAGLAKGSAPVLTKVPNQPAEYNNVAPAYGSDDQIFFASDRPITGNPIHYPQIEEYESGHTVSGLWKLNPTDGTLTLLDHSPSGLFTPFVDSFGQVIFTRWDHLAQDQQAFRAFRKLLEPGYDEFFRAYTYEHENDVGESKRELVSDFFVRKIALNTPQTDLQAWGVGETVIPEYLDQHPLLSSPAFASRNGQVYGTLNGRTLRYFTPTNKYGRLNGSKFNLFLPWQINQDGSGDETFRHIGRHELGVFSPANYIDDPALRDLSVDEKLTPLAKLAGYFNVVEVPTTVAPGGGTYIGAVSPEFNGHTSGFILRMRDKEQRIHENGLAVEFTKLTSPDSQTRYRNPVMLADGTLIASVDEVPVNVKGTIQPPSERMKFRLYRLKLGADGMYEPDQQLTTGNSRTFQYWDPDTLQSWNGRLWEISPVEVRARPRPPRAVEPPMPAPEATAFTQAGVDPSAFRQFLRDNDLALIVARDVTRRDQDDNQQPSNLRVDPQNVPAGKVGAQTLRTGQAGARVYDVAKVQMYQNDLVRGYLAYNTGSLGTFKDGGRRGLARPLNHAAAVAANPTSTGVPGTRIAFDGSMAMFVPARRALVWTLADRDDIPIVRERYWLTFASGEVRVCASCHGVNSKSQSGGTAASQVPQALVDLLNHWKRTDSGTTSVITHYYQSILRRAPDSGGLAFWEDEALRVRAHGASINDTFFALSGTFLASPEYSAFNRDATGFVTDLYKAFFDRSPDPGGLSFWLGNLNQGMPREVAYVSFLFSNEFSTFMQGKFGPIAARPEVDMVLDFYRGLLGRLPDSGGLDNWLRAFRRAQCDGSAAVASTVKSISTAFANSGEYQGRRRTNAQYVGDLYNAFMRRGGDLNGVKFWITQLDTGAVTRDSLLQTFAGSPEFSARVQKVSSEACLL